MGIYSGKPISEWAVEDRPREKMNDKGIDSLTDAELLGILLGTGFGRKSAVDLGRDLLIAFGGIHRLATASEKELLTIPGIGRAKASTLRAGFELHRRRMAYETRLTSFKSSSQMARFLRAAIGNLSREVFHVVFLNNNNEVLGQETLFSGGVSETLVDPKVVFKSAISHLAPRIVVSHNHPSGNHKPSDADDKITRRLVAGGRLLGVEVLDHIIIGARDHYSYADMGRIV